MFKKKKHPIADAADSAVELGHDLKADLANLGADALKVAQDHLAPKARDLADYLAPKVKDAAENVADYVQPRAQDLGRRGVAFVSETRETLQPKLTHLAADTADNLRPFLDDARDRLQPHLDDAFARVQPLVDAGRDRLNAEVLPRLVDAYEHAAAAPQAQEAKDRLLATRAALAGELTLPEEKKKGGFLRTIFKLLVATGLLAGVAYALKRFLNPEESGWEAHEPSRAYTRPEPTEAADSTSSDEADPLVVSPYGEGSYVGVEPGEEFVIKGNERSMKYHLAGSGGYEGTIADVWFSSEEAAQAAGFTKAQR